MRDGPTAVRSADPRRVVFGPGFLRRLEGLVRRCRRARGSGVGAGRSRTLGPGDETHGHRPYRPGEELRHLDWELLARSDRAFVRVFRREAGERTSVMLDASASMGLGAPGKLQWAAEVATGIAFAGLVAGARTRIVVGGGARALEESRRGEAGVRRGPELARATDLVAWLRFLEGLEAGGVLGLGASLEAAPPPAGGRLVLVGDLLDLTPGAVRAVARRGRCVDLVRVLAPHELRPPEGGRGVRWVDPECGESLTVRPDRALAARYAEALGRELGRWDRLARRARVTHTVWSSATPFERAAERLAGDSFAGRAGMDAGVER